MPKAISVFAFLALSTVCISAEDASPISRWAHQAPDQDGIYYAGPEVTPPRLARTFSVPYPDDVPDWDIEGMTVLAMVIESNGSPAHIQILHPHGNAFDQASIAAVKRSYFEPGRMGDKPVPVWIDVRVVFHSNRGRAIPQVVIAERDLPLPDLSRFEDKHHNPLSYIEPIPIHVVDADFADPFAKHPYVQEAVVTVLVGEDGLPKEVRVKRGLGFGLDQKAEAAVWQYRFLPAMKQGKPVSASREVLVDFAVF
jgi:TonB family protein